MTASASPTPTASAEQPDLAQMAWFVWEEDELGDLMTLYVGRLDGRITQLMTLPSDALPSGARPVNGTMVAWWREGEETVVSQIDTADGSMNEMMRVDEYLVGEVDPQGQYFYWLAFEPDGNPSGLWRRPLAGGLTEQILDSGVTGYDLVFDHDGSRLLIHGGTPGVPTAEDYRVLYVGSGDLIELLGTGHSTAVGFLGPDLVVYDHSISGELSFPLTAINPRDGSGRILVAQEGLGAAIYEGAEGPQLIYGTAGPAGNYQVRAMHVGGEQGRVIYNSNESFREPGTASFMRRASGRGVEFNGWVPIFPAHFAYLDEPVPDRVAGVSWLLISLQNDSVVEIPPLVLEESE